MGHGWDLGWALGVGQLDPAFPRSGSLAWTTVLCVCVCFSKWTGRSLLCGAAHMGGSRDLEAPSQGPVSDSTGVRKLVELLQGGFGCVTGWKHSHSSPV